MYRLNELLVENSDCLITYRADRKAKKIYYRGNIVHDMSMLNNTQEAKEVFDEIDEDIQRVILKRYLAEKNGEDPLQFPLPYDKKKEERYSHASSTPEWANKRTIKIDGI